jgi:hypothetical protein
MGVHTLNAANGIELIDLVGPLGKKLPWRR